MNFTLFDRILFQLPQGTTIFPFWRGESLLHPDFQYLMGQAAENMEFVMATNGLLLALSEATFPVYLIHEFKAVSVSIHNRLSLAGLRRLLAMRGKSTVPEITATMVEGEDTGVGLDELDIADKVRIYREHTLNGVWGKTEGVSPVEQTWCKRLDTDLVIAWDGSISRCCYVWDDPATKELNANTMTLNAIAEKMEWIGDNYPDEVCRNCNQWQGNGRTL